MDRQPCLWRSTCTAVFGRVAGFVAPAAARRLARALAVPVLAALMLQCGAGPVEATAPETAGLAIGRPAPAFALTDQTGTVVSLESLLKTGPVALVFSRSVDWCLYCKLQLVHLQRDLGEIEASGSRVVCITHDSVEKIHAFATRSGITFPVLSDPESKAIDAYDIRCTDAPPEFRGIARHATFIIGQDGVIRSKLFELSYQERSAVNALIHALEEARTMNGRSRT